MTNRILIFLFLWGLSFSSYSTVNKELSIEKLNDKVYLIKGERVGANVGVVIGDDEILLVDTMLKKYENELIAAVQSISKLPIKYIINTHGDFDHVGANEKLRESGVEVIAQQNVSHSKIECDICFDRNISLQLSSKIRVESVAVVSHSFSDSIISVPNQNVVFMGDILTNNSHPTFYKGGLLGMNKAITYALKIGNENTQYVAGHGFVVNKKQLLHYLTITKKLTAFIIQKSKEGLSPEQIVNANGFEFIYEQLENLTTFKATNKQRLIRFVHRIISTEVVGNPEVSLMDYVGVYVWEDGSTFNLIYENNKLFYKEKGRRILELIPKSSVKFVGRGQLDRFYQFDFDDKNRVFKFTYYLKSEPKSKALKLMN